MKKNTRLLLTATLLILGAGRALGRPTPDAARHAGFLNMSPERHAPYYGQVADDIDTALAKNAEAETYEQWQSSGYTPADIIGNVRRLGAWNALCEKLVQLSDEDLSMFENDLAESSTHRNMPCDFWLASRLEAHWSFEDYALSREHDSPRSGDTIALPTQVTIPNMERHLDASKGETLFRGENKDGEITLTFDDGPHPRLSRKILNTLTGAGIRANYFMTGGNAKIHTPIVKEICGGEIRQVEDEYGKRTIGGQVCGSHSWNHQLLPRLPLGPAVSEITCSAAQRMTAHGQIICGHRAVEAASGIQVPFFRFPYGGRNAILEQFVRELPMASFMWNIDTLDWKVRNPPELLVRVKKLLVNLKGGIVLFHDIQPQTNTILPHVIEEMSRLNVTHVTYVPH